MYLRARPRAIGSDRGSVAAELALTIPAVVLVLLLGVGALGAASQQVSLQDAAADAARLLSRGESAGTAQGAVSANVAGATLSSWQAEGLICTTARLDVSLGALLRIPLHASSCALAGGL